MLFPVVKIIGLFILLACAVLNAHGQLVRKANTTLSLPANLPSATGYQLANAFGSLTFDAPICTATLPGESDRLLVAERAGKIRIVTNLQNSPNSSLYLDLSTLLGPNERLAQDFDAENGLLALAVHPNFATNGTIFVFYSILGAEHGGEWLYQRLHKVVLLNPASNTPTVQSHTPLLTMLDPAGNHNGGDLGFGPDGYLYLSLGDGGYSGDYFDNSRHINKDFWGQLLRLDVDNRPGNLEPNPHTQTANFAPSAIHPGTYRIPADNPFIGKTVWHGVALNPAKVRTEIYATGLRNPFRFSFDTPTGRLLLGDVGQGEYEEINIITKGGDFGWCWREGPIAIPSYNPPVDPPADFHPVEPIFSFRHHSSATEVWGGSVIGGIIYRGHRLTEMVGAYLFADYVSGCVAVLKEDYGVWTATRILEKTGIVDFGTDPRNGDALMCDLGSGVIWRLERTSTTGTPPPATLSATGAFENIHDLTPNPGLVPYAPRVSFWSDYAQKSRWFTIPNLTDKITFSEGGNWTLPTGTVWVKHFNIETARGNPSTERKLETRFLVKTETDVYGLTYRWRDDQSDADLVPEEGLTAQIIGSNPAQTWRFPSRSECRTCHTAQSGFALSFNTRQMNREHDHGALTQNQITALSSAGYFTTPAPSPHTLPALPDPADTAQSLDARVRSYLMVNCAQCHQPNGTATGNWDARITTRTDLASLIRGPLANAFGDSANRFAVPNDLGHSMVYKRVQGSGVPRMPPLGTLERDLAAEELLREWITQGLPTRQSFPEWQTQHFGGPAVPEAAPQADGDADGQTNALEFLRGTLPTKPNAPRLPVTTLDGDFIGVTFTNPANRSALIETSTDLLEWRLWDVPGNNPQYPAGDTQRILIGPVDGPNRYFRLRLGDL